MFGLKNYPRGFAQCAKKVWAKSLRQLVILMLVCFWLSAYADNEGIRLLLTDANSHTVYVFDAHKGEKLASFSTPGEAGRAYASPNGSYGFVVHRDEHRVSLVYAGLETEGHGDHIDLLETVPYIASTYNLGQKPTHFFAHDNDIAFFNDASGTVAVLEQRMLGISSDYRKIQVAQPDHGAPVVYKNHVLVGYLDLGRVDIYDQDDEVIVRFEACPRLHGEAMSGNSIVFGCSDGVLIIKENASVFTATKLENPLGAPEGARVGTVVAHEDSQVMIGNFGSGIVIIDLQAKTLTPILLPSNPVSMKFVSKDSLIVLTADGYLHKLEPTTGRVLLSQAATDALEPEAVRPSLALNDELIYLTQPSTKTLHEFELETLSQLRSMELEFTPFSLALLQLEGVVKH